MGLLARLPLDGGGAVLLEMADTRQGPVKAGRLTDAIQDLPSTVQQTLRPVTDLAQAALDQLRQAGPDDIEIAFGVDLSAEAGAIITKTAANCHLTVTVTWHRTPANEPDRAAATP